MTLAEAGQFLRLSHNTLRKQIRLGRLSAVVIGRRKFVAPSELDRFIAHNSTNGGAA
ncbi:MAG: helix-turn-helix domain-containing protein [Pirellulales bacterium]|nr:helix-turn-helix domain-containing protein [Pirellulales bacterium]